MINYDYLTKILHRQFLVNGEILDLSIKQIESKSSNIKFNRSNNIFITGLARAGTTSLLRCIDNSGDFSSFRYNYMPFVLIPKVAGFYSKFFKKRINYSYERIHGDGIKINFLSPECLDEPYWINTIYQKY